MGATELKRTHPSCYNLSVELMVEDLNGTMIGKTLPCKKRNKQEIHW